MPAQLEQLGNLGQIGDDKGGMIQLIRRLISPQSVALLEDAASSVGALARNASRDVKGIPLVRLNGNAVTAMFRNQAATVARFRPDAPSSVAWAPTGVGSGQVAWAGPQGAQRRVGILTMPLGGEPISNIVVLDQLPASWRSPAAQHLWVSEAITAKNRKELMAALRSDAGFGQWQQNKLSGLELNVA